MPKYTDRDTGDFILRSQGMKDKKYEYLDIAIAALIGIMVWLAVMVVGCRPVWADDIDDITPAIIEVESGWNASALSPAGCIGLMQINPDGALKEFNDNNYTLLVRGVPYTPDKWDLYNPHYNIAIGQWYLRRLKDHYLKDNYTIERMLAAYNCGPTKLKSVGYDISKCPRETREYVKKVMKIYRKEATK